MGTSLSAKRSIFNLEETARMDALLFMAVSIPKLTVSTDDGDDKGMIQHHTGIKDALLMSVRRLSINHQTNCSMHPCPSHSTAAPSLLL